MTFLDAYRAQESLSLIISEVFKLPFALKLLPQLATGRRRKWKRGREREGNNYKVICNSIISVSFHSVYLLAKTRCWPKTVCQLQIAKFFFLCLRFKVNVAFASHEVGSKMKRVEGEREEERGGRWEKGNRDSHWPLD